VSTLRLLGAMAISIFPLQRARRLLYRAILGYHIDQHAKIGFMTIIAVDSAEIEAVKVGMFNKFVGPYNLIIKKGTSIGRSNEFCCGRWVTEGSFISNHYERFCHIGENCVLTQSHYIDTTGGFLLGDRSWIAGCYSQFWTHGIGVELRTISIGEDCYVGSAARFAPGSSIGKNNLVGLGSVVVGSLNIDSALIAGVPAKVIEANYHWRARHTKSANGFHEQVL
jgi:acetyltransferase-like isoleucine patch superfamily enzyme